MIISWTRGALFQPQRYLGNNLGHAWKQIRAPSHISIIQGKGAVFFDFQQGIVMGDLTTEVICYNDYPISPVIENPLVTGQGRVINITGTVSTNI